MDELVLWGMMVGWNDHKEAHSARDGGMIMEIHILQRKGNDHGGTHSSGEGGWVFGRVIQKHIPREDRHYHRKIKERRGQFHLGFEVQIG